ncbi:MAG: DUF4416 family protein [Candidatus Brocadiia bacterium]
MGETRKPRAVNLICAVLAGRPEWLKVARDRLERSFGPIDLASDTWPFDQTDYYAAEMGEGLLRQVFSFAELVAADNLVAVKHTTNRLEKELARSLEAEPERPVNLDPGYIGLSKLVLATTKDYTHRIYLGGGIYAEVTLRWRDGAFEPYEWTYPDYRQERQREFLTRVRRAYREKLDNPRR